MIFLKKHWILIFEIFFFTIIFYLSIIPLRDFDIWFHVKSGEIIAQKGIIHYDVFSHSAAGREWFPYEWLYQLTMYWVQEGFGFESIKIINAAIITIMLGFIYNIFKKIFNLSPLLSAFVCFVFFVSLYEFFSARPHVLAYTLLLATIYLIFLYTFRSKNYLYFSIPITLIWANFHGSIFLDIFLFGAYAFVCFINYFIFKDKNWIKKGKTLSMYTGITAILTILPPLGILQYRLLWNFFTDNKFISKFIEEWTPLENNPYAFTFFTTTLAMIMLIFVITVWKTKQWKKMIWALPLIPFIILPYSASRNVFLGYITFAIFLGWSLSQIKYGEINRLLKLLFVLLIISILGLHIWILHQKSIPRRLYYPVKATMFIKQNQLKGNMFNEYGYGGYLLYNLYPEQKVFFDGRTDVYLCCEMREVMNLALNKELPDDKYKNVLDSFWKKYNISYVLFRTEKHSAFRKIGRVLTDHSDWSLVFWDDDTILFLKNDGKNPEVFENFSTSAATPYNRDPYRKDQQDQAFLEYERMIQVADSAKSRNAIGYIYLRQGKYDEAKVEFERAIYLDPSNESPFMNLAELYAKDGNFDEAIRLYGEARKIAPDRGLVYIRLGQLTLESTGDMEAARAIWQEGLSKTVDSEAKDKLRKLLEN